MADRLTVPGEEIEMDFTNFDLHPELNKFEELNKVVALAEVLNKKESAPNIGLGMEVFAV